MCTAFCAEAAAFCAEAAAEHHQHRAWPPSGEMHAASVAFIADRQDGATDA